jgi:hypothetical protein
MGYDEKNPILANKLKAIQEAKEPKKQDKKPFLDYINSGKKEKPKTKINKLKF